MVAEASTVLCHRPCQQTTCIPCHTLIWTLVWNASLAPGVAAAGALAGTAGAAVFASAFWGAAGRGALTGAAVWDTKQTVQIDWQISACAQASMQQHKAAPCASTWSRCTCHNAHALHAPAALISNAPALGAPPAAPARIASSFAIALSMAAISFRQLRTVFEALSLCGLGVLFSKQSSLGALSAKCTWSVLQITRNTWTSAQKQLSLFRRTTGDGEFNAISCARRPSSWNLWQAFPPFLRQAAPHG